MIKVSVIVPVYNVQEYLDKCLSSLVNQTLKEIEIIVVNDGTKDNSQDIIDRYKKKYSNIKSYIKDNGGLSDARNYGIKRAKGEYIGFVDSDDYVDLNMYKTLYEKAKCGNFDIVVCDVNSVDEGTDKITRIDSNIKDDTYDIKDAMVRLYPAAWNKIYKRELIVNKIEFKKGVWFEDVEFIYRLLPFVKSIGVVKEAFVYYLQRAGSITKSVDPRIYNYIDNWMGIIEYYKSNSLYNEYYDEIEYCFVRYIYATFIKSACKYEYIEYKKAVKCAREAVNKFFPKYRHNKYFYKSLKGLYLVLFNNFMAFIIYRINNK